jgi:hypothetical protein
MPTEQASIQSILGDGLMFLARNGGVMLPQLGVL